MPIFTDAKSIVEDRIKKLQSAKLAGTISEPVVEIEYELMQKVIKDLQTYAMSLQSERAGFDIQTQFFNECVDVKYGSQDGDMSGAIIPGSEVTREQVNSSPSEKSSIPTWNSNHPSRIVEYDDGGII